MLSDINNNNGFWEGTVQLDYWMAYFETHEPISLNVGGDKLISEINDTHINGYYYLIKNQQSILNSILSALIDIYPQLQEQYNYDEDEKSKYMPDIIKQEDFKKIIKPNTITIIDVAKDGMAYVGFGFDCEWDDEHGLGVMTHSSKIVRIGGADTSSLTWIAEQDL